MNLFKLATTRKYFKDESKRSIDQKLLRDLYSYTQKSLIALLLLSFLLFIFLVGAVPGIILYPWFFLAVGINISRIYDSCQYLQHDYDGNYQKWYRKFRYKSYLTAFLWGSISLLFLPHIEDQELRMMVFMFIIGIGGGAMTTIAPDIRTAGIYLFLLMAPLAGYVVSLGSSTDEILAFLIVVYYFLLLNVSRSVGESLTKNYIQEEQYEQTQQALYVKQDELNSLFKQAPIGVFYFDNDLKIIDCNKAFEKLFDADENSLIGLDIHDLPDKRPLLAIENAITDGAQFYNGPYTSIKGKHMWVEAKISPIINSKKEILGGIGLIENKTGEKKALDELNYMARHDALTSLRNRRSFTEYMEDLVSQEKHRDHYSILFYLDLNQFKNINDTMGHSVGDQLLIEVAKRLQLLLKEGYMLSRLGGDEFVIVLSFIAKSKKDARARADICSRNLQKAFISAFLIEEMHLYVKSSIGIVIIEPKTHNIEEIIRYADISMYDAKRKGRDTIAYYNTDLDRERKELFSLQHDLYHAIENHQLKLYYQPIVTIKDDTLKAAEALVRWYHPSRGILTPSQFIPLAIESGLIDDIGWLVIDIVCQQIQEWKGDSIFPMDYISVNVDAMQLQRGRFVEKFFAILERYSVHPGEIKLEITESSLIDNFEQTREIIQTLKDRGIRCAIDDFGTGYSSLSYLKKFSFSVLKIDREFIKDILEKSEDLFLVESIITIGKRLGYRIVVEGIETQEQKNLLRKIDDTLRYQGYLFSPALSALDFKNKFCIKCQES